MQTEFKSIRVVRKAPGQHHGCRGGKRRRERGVALITALLLLLLVTGLGSVMSVSLNSDMMMNGYFGNFRGSFYAADSGVALARQEMMNQLLGSANLTFSTTAAPISSAATSAALNTMLSEFGTGSILNQGNGTISSMAATGSWPAQFYLDPGSTNGKLNTNLTLVDCNVTPTAAPLGPPPAPIPPAVDRKDGTCAAPPAGGTAYEYDYDYLYVIRAIGISQGGQKAAIREEGHLKLVFKNSSSSTRSFSSYGTFINVMTQCKSELVGGTITGEQFTNGSWTFGHDYTYTFTDPVGSNSTTAGYYFGSNNCYPSTQTSYTYNPGGHGGSQTITPNFQNGLNLGQNTIPLPTNDYNQERAVIDSLGTSNTQVSNTELNASVKDVNGNPYNQNGASSGVYLPYTINSQTGAATFNGGGIYVQGDASVALSTSGSSAEVYTITQSNTVTTITIDNSANTTTFASKTGSNSTITKSISGVPVMYLTSGGPASNATMLYVNGNITSLAGPSNAPAVQDGTALTITAANNITITNNITYKTEPVTLTASGSTPVGSLISGNNNGQTLGIFTANGAVILNPPGNGGGNMEIDASIAATSQSDSTSSCTMTYICNGSISVANNNTIGTLTIVGGRIQNISQSMPAGTIGTRNIIYDRRYQGGSFAPPFFPSTTITSLPTPTYTSSLSVQRQQWVSELIF